MRSNREFFFETAIAVLLTILLFPAFAEPQPARGQNLPPGARVIRDISYGAAEGHPLLLDLYLPEPGGTPLPLVVWIHGGGWRSGSKANCRPALNLVSRGYAVASIGYRLTGISSFPAQIEDCKAAVRFLRANAVEYNIDTERIGAWGSSAGGHLACLLGTAGGAEEFEKGANLEYSSRIRAVCSYFGPTSLAEAGGRIESPASPESLLTGGEGAEERRKRAAKASPLTYAGADSPPFLFVHGDRDRVVNLRQSVILHEKLLAAGVESTLIVIEGAGHGGPEFASGETIGKVAAFFDRHLKGGPDNDGEVVKEIFKTSPPSRIIGGPGNTRPSTGAGGVITIEGSGSGFRVNPAKISAAARPDIFSEGYFSVFDVLLHACREKGIDVQYRFDSGMNTHVIDSIGGKTDWWYAAHYHGGSRHEEPLHRMDLFPYKDRMSIRVYTVSRERMNEIYSSFRKETERFRANGGRVIIPEVSFGFPGGGMNFKDVEVKAHDIRGDMFRPGVVTAADVVLSLAGQGKISFDLAWLEEIGRTVVRGYYFTRFGGREAQGRAGFVYELGDANFRGRRGFNNNNLHVTSDIRTVLSPDYVLWRWADLSPRN